MSERNSKGKDKQLNAQICYGLSYECPKGLDRGESCPFTAIDHLTFKEKIEWLDKLSEKERKELIEHHYYCTNQGGG